MCGIAGQFNFQRHQPVERETIVRMARSIATADPTMKASSLPVLSAWDSVGYRLSTLRAVISRCRMREKQCG